MRLVVEVEIEEDAELEHATELLANLKDLSKHVHPNAIFRGVVKSPIRSAIWDIIRGAKDSNVQETAAAIRQKIAGMPAREADKAIIESVEEVLYSLDTETEDAKVTPYLTAARDSCADPKVAFNELARRLLNFLRIQRPVYAPRDEFFAQAAAFAMLVKFQVVEVNQALRFYTEMISNETTRCAGITTLGKTVQLYLEGVQAAQQNVLAGLRDALMQVHEHFFNYDIQYLWQYLGFSWSQPRRLQPQMLPQHPPHPHGLSQQQQHPQPQPHVHHHPSPQPRPQPQPRSQPSPPLSPGFVLRKKKSHTGHNDVIFAVSADQHDNVISAAKDGKIITHNKKGESHVVSLSGSYVCSMDIAPQAGLVYFCCYSQQAKIAPYSISQSGELTAKEAIPKPDVMIVSCLRILPSRMDGSMFVAGESRRTEMDKNVVSLYDLQSGTKPIRDFKEHTDIVTTLTCHSLHNTMFLSGSRDRAICLWDINSGVCQARLNHHGITISSLVTDGNYLVSADLGEDQNVVVWDLRRISDSSTTPLTSFSVREPALKLAIRNTKCLVATDSGLHGFNVANPSPILQEGTDSYHDVTISHDGNYVYAGGKKAKVDCFEILASPC